MTLISEIPRPDPFRRWVAAAMASLELRPATAARAIGASVNSVGAFLRDPARDITLSRAADLERHLRGVAADRGVDLGPICPPGAGGDA